MFLIYCKLNIVEGICQKRGDIVCVCVCVCVIATGLGEDHQW